jgi:hypothetical protein
MAVSPQDVEFDVIKWLVSAVVGVLSVLYGLLHTRVTDLEKEIDVKVDKDTIAEMRKLMEEHRGETRAQFSSVTNTLNTILLEVGKIK